MIERLMHKIHFAVDPHNSSKKQALEVMHELQKHFPIKRSSMRLQLTVPERNLPSLIEKLTSWNASIISKDELADQLSVVCGIKTSCLSVSHLDHVLYMTFLLTKHGVNKELTLCILVLDECHHMVIIAFSDLLSVVCKLGKYSTEKDFYDGYNGVLDVPNYAKRMACYHRPYKDLWNGRPPDEAIWEDYWVIGQKFPSFDLEAKSNSGGKYLMHAERLSAGFVGWSSGLCGSGLSGLLRNKEKRVV